MTCWASSNSRAHRNAGSNGSDSRIGRFSLTTAAKNLAIEASKQCEYVGPAPVPLQQYQDQVQKQRLSNEKVSINDISACLSHLILPASVIRKLGPAINSGRSLLIYGPPGNGKTSISEAIGKVFDSLYLFRIVLKWMGRLSGFLTVRCILRVVRGSTGL